MVTERNTYVIDPETTDPDLIHSLTPLAEDPGPATRRSPSARRRRRVFPEATATTVKPPRRPVLWLTSALALGPFSIFMTGDRRSWPRWVLAATPVVLAGIAAWIWTRDPARFGGGDRTMVIEAAAAATAGVTWLCAAAIGLVMAARRCPEGPLARRGARRPLIAGLSGLCAPGLGLLLAGRPLRTVAAVVLVGIGGLAGLALWRASEWWAWHRLAAAHLFSDLQLETALVALAGLAVIGGLAWLVSVLEAGRVAAGPRVVRAISGADRVPAALLLALVAFGIWFRPVEAAREFDRVSGDLAAAELRLSSMLTARAAALLAPADPVLAVRVADREAALGHFATAAAIRDELDRRWRRFEEIERTASAWLPTDFVPANPAPPTPWETPQVAPKDSPRAFAPALAAMASPPPPVP